MWCNIASISTFTCVVKFHGLHLGQSRAECPGPAGCTGILVVMLFRQCQLAHCLSSSCETLIGDRVSGGVMNFYVMCEPLFCRDIYTFSLVHGIPMLRD